MGNRYVWERYALDGRVQIDASPQPDTDIVRSSISGGGTIANAHGYSTCTVENGKLVLSDSGIKWQSTLTGDQSYITGYGDFYVKTAVGSKILFMKGKNSGPSSGIYAYFNTFEYSPGLFTSVPARAVASYAFLVSLVMDQKGEWVGTVTGSSGAYPSDGISGSYWYVYKGSDSIDPASLSYPASPKSTVPITLTVTPSKGNTYGGTVSYQYEVSLDGGNSWAQLGLTTALTMDYTIPKGTQTFRARVQARDGLGFTSSEWIYGPQVAVINNAAPSAPGSITVPVSPRGGADTAVTWPRAEDPDGNLAGYRLERQLDGGAWSQIYDGQGLSHVDVIPKGTLTAAYRVKAYDSDGEESPYTTSPVRTVVNNSPPVISCDLSGDLGVKSAGFTVSYTVTDAEGGAVTVEERAGGLVKRTFSPTLGQSNTFQVTGEFFMRILNGPQELSITATDEGGLSSVCTLTFTKKVYAMSVTLAQPLEVDGPITVAIMSVLQSIPEDAAYQILVTNNAKDAQPAWQDATADVRAGRNIVFTNQTQESGPAFNFRLTASRAEGGQGGYVKLLKGAFQ